MTSLNLDNIPKKGEALTYKTRGASFQMIVQDARIRYGKIDVLVSPLAGSGAFWVRYDNLKQPTTVTEVKDVNGEVLETVNA